MDIDRIKHSLAVAEKMIELGKERQLNEKELQDLFILGINHDIGYEFGNRENHNTVGGNILKNNGYKYWQEVYWHGNSKADYNSIYLDILNEADLSIDRYGEEVGYEKRLEDIKSRYGIKSMQYSNSLEIIKKLKEGGAKQCQPYS